MINLLYLTVGLLFYFPAYAGNWMSKTDMDAARSGAQGSNNYTNSQAACEAAEAEPCFDRDVCTDPRYCTVQNLRRGSLEPASSITDCADPAACVAAISDTVAKCGDASYQALWGDRDGDDDADGVRDLESWCTRRALIDVLEVDTGLQSAHDAAEAVKAADAATRATAGGQRKLDVAACITALNGVPPLSAVDIKTCLGLVMKEVYEKEVATGDL